MGHWEGQDGHLRITPRQSPFPPGWLCQEQGATVGYLWLHLEKKKRRLMCHCPGGQSWAWGAGSREQLGFAAGQTRSPNPEEPSHSLLQGEGEGAA